MLRKLKRLRITALVLTALCLSLAGCSACAGEELSGSIDADLWGWNPGTVNTFTGTADLSPWQGSTVTLRIQAEPDPRPEEETGTPLFVIVNDKRIVMMSQKDTAEVEAGTDSVPFTCSYKMPGDTRLDGLTLRVTAIDVTGNELGSFEKKLWYSVLNADKTGNSFRIPFEIRTVALWIAGAGALAWIAAVLRNRLLHKKH